jgi:methyltransferase (TIGR00027 family)
VQGRGAGRRRRSFVLRSRTPLRAYAGDRNVAFDVGQLVSSPAVRTGLPSFTAMAVAGARAVAGVDASAERLLPRPLGSAVGALRGSRVARLLSFGLVDHLELRTRAIDDVIAHVAAPQVVVLGAGLDSRAYRMSALAEAIVFEVDHPATQAFKRARASKLARAAREVRFVGVDFEREDLGERLGASGHDPAQPTTWIWEGVTPYLTEEAIDATLGVLEARSADGSALVMTYVTPELETLSRALRPLVLPGLRLLGEPLRGRVTHARAHALVRAHGFDVTADEGIAELARRYGLREPRVIIPERVLVARH